VGVYDPVNDRVVWSEDKNDIVWAGNVVGGSAPGSDSVIDGGSSGEAAYSKTVIIIALAAAAGFIALLAFLKSRSSGKPGSKNRKMSVGSRRHEEASQKIKALELTVMEQKVQRERKQQDYQVRENQLAEKLGNAEKLIQENALINRINVLNADDLILKKNNVGTEIEETFVLGQGAYGKVYQGLYFGTQVAVKEVNNNLLDGYDLTEASNDGNMNTEEETASCLKNELKFAQLIRHPACITCMGFVELPDKFYMVMEMASQGSLKDVLQRDDVHECEGLTTEKPADRPAGRKSSQVTCPAMVTGSSKKRIDSLMKSIENEVDTSDEGTDFNAKNNVPAVRELGWRHKVNWLYSIAGGLEFLHGKKIVYRDLKCDNVLITEGLEAKLADWGTCIHLDSDDGRVYGRCGTVAFMSPEVYLDDAGGYDGKADIYSFGVLIIELGLHGKLVEGVKRLEWDKPGRSKTVGTFVRRMAGGSRPTNFEELLQDKEEDNSDIVEALNSLMLRCCSPNPEERPTAHEIHAELGVLKAVSFQGENTIKAFSARIDRN
jgi:serine/threonine protein kinase